MTAPEVVHHFENLFNYRDAGGMRTTDGRTMRRGVLFRSDELSRLNERDLATLRRFGIKLICDLRSSREHQRKPAHESLRVVNISLHAETADDKSRSRMASFVTGQTGAAEFLGFTRRYYRHLAFERAPVICEIMTLLSGPESMPALIHCTAGKDRTGVVIALLQLLAGVPYDAVRADYLRTNDYFDSRFDDFLKLQPSRSAAIDPERLRTLLRVVPEFLDEVHDGIVEQHGSVERYLGEVCNVAPTALQNLKSQLLE